MANTLNSSRFNIGISAAEPTDMQLWGINSTHIKDAIMELARYSINSGYAVSYGGDLQYRHFINFPVLLKEIALRYTPNWSVDSKEKNITNYLAWHLGIETSKETKDAFTKFMNIVDTPAPIEIEKNNNIMPFGVLKPIHKARALSKMREVMNEEIDARVFLAGKIIGSSGIYPGLIEEAYLALKSKKPVFLLGGFGGCTHKIVELIKKEQPKEITLEYQVENDVKKNELIKEYEFTASLHPEYNFPDIDYNKIISFFEAVGVDGLNNGLTRNENEILFETRNIKEMLSLLFKGLDIVSNK